MAHVRLHADLSSMQGSPCHSLHADPISAASALLIAYTYDIPPNRMPYESHGMTMTSTTISRLSC